MSDLVMKCLCYTLLCICFSCVRFFATLQTVARQTPLSMDFPDKNTGVDCHAFLQGIFPTQRLNPCLLHLLHGKMSSVLLSYQGNPTLC